MRIGIDFDNTIVSYDLVFHRVALEAGHIPPDLPVSKISVRDYLRRHDKEHLWTEMQGYVYGVRMGEADAFPGVVDFLAWARDAGLAVAVISHRTRYPFIGPRHDLHHAARRWIETALRGTDGRLIDPGQVFFELTPEDKLRRIAERGCEYFVDDLPEIFLAPEFPQSTARLLFDPDGRHNGRSGLTAFRDWRQVRGYLEARWRPAR
jgi:hypothetical protein